MLNRFEATGIFISIALMSLALFILNMESATQELSGVGDDAAATVVLSDDNLADTLLSSVNKDCSIAKLIVDDVVVGSGDSVKQGDKVSVHYIGTLQNGQQFDNSYLNGEPFQFVVGAGSVIKGWEEGIQGMKAGGQRILVIPSAMAYGEEGIGPIPPNATLIFSIELLAVNPDKVE